MITDWYNPQTISQYAEQGGENLHITWDDSTNFASLKVANGTSVGTTTDLVHISRSPKPDITNKTYYLKCTNFKFSNLSTTISGIECKITSRPSGRVTDDTVNLIYNDQLIGENQATLDINPIKLYGGPDSLWGLSSVESATIMDQSFGILLRYKSHPSWPHSDPMDLISVQLRIY